MRCVQRAELKGIITKRSSDGRLLRGNAVGIFDPIYALTKYRSVRSRLYKVTGAPDLSSHCMRHRPLRQCSTCVRSLMEQRTTNHPYF